MRRFVYHTTRLVFHRVLFLFPAASTPMKLGLALVLLHVSTVCSFLTLPPRVSTASALSMKLGRAGVSFNRHPSVLGLVGGIASGKSTVSKVLSDCGVAVIDADKLGHESYQPGTRCFAKLVDEFGSKIVANDGTIDRRALGEAVRFLEYVVSR